MTNILTDKLKLNKKGVISIVGAGGKTSLMFLLAKELAGSGKTVLTTTTTKIFMPTPEQSPFTIIAGSIAELAEKSRSRLNRYHHFSAGKEYTLKTGKLTGFSPGSIDQLWQTGLFDWIIVEADGARQKPIKATALHEPVIPKVTTHLILVTGLDAIGKTLDENHVHRAAVFSKNTQLAMGETIDEQSIATSIAMEIKKAKDFCNAPSNFVFLNKADNPDKLSSGKKIAELLQTSKIINQIITASFIDDNPVKSCFNTQKKILNS